MSPGVQKSRALLFEVCVSWMRRGGSGFSTTLFESNKKPHERREMERSRMEDLLLRGSGVSTWEETGSRSWNNEKSNVQRDGGRGEKVRNGCQDGSSLLEHTGKRTQCQNVPGTEKSRRCNQLRRQGGAGEAQNRTTDRLTCPKLRKQR